MRNLKGQFIKGHSGYKAWLGKKFSKKHKEKLSKAHKLIPNGMLGFKFSEESKIKMSKSHIGKLVGEKNPAKRLEVRRKISEANKGSKSYNWKGGITRKTDIIRHGLDYKLWRESVFKRDEYTCKKCKYNRKLDKIVKRRELTPHHILNFIKHIKLRFDIDNGITLCKYCHIEFHKIYGFKNNTIKQIKEFII